MKKIKKLLALAMAMCMIFSMSTVAFAEDEMGTAGNPWQVSSTATKNTVWFEVGATQYIQVDDCDGTSLNVVYATDENVEEGVFSYSVQYGTGDAQTPGEDGLISVALDSTTGDTLVITNTDDEAFTLFFTVTSGENAEPTGTMDDPFELTFQKDWMGNLAAQVDQEFDAKSAGYYYTIEAPADGNITVGIRGAIDADFNNIDWMYGVNNYSANKYGDTHWSDDEEPVFYEVWEVKKGEELTIYLNTYNTEDMFNNPAGTITLQLSFDAIGSYNNPGKLVIGENTVTLEADTQGYNYVWTATEDGTLKFTMDTATNWTYCLNNFDAGIYGDTHWSDDDPVVSTESVKVNAGDEISLMVNTYDNGLAPAGTIEFTAEFISKYAEDDTVITEEEIEELGTTVSGNANGTELVVTPVLTEKFEEIKTIVADAIDKAYQMIEITLVDANGTTVQPADGTTVSITMAVPEILEDATKVEVSRFDETTDKLVVVATVDVVDGKITFAADHFSTYVFADATPAPVVTPPATNAPDTADMAPIAMIIVIAAVAAVVVLKKRTVEN